MGVAESYGFPFIQEVVASTRLIRQRWPDVRTLIEIGGEDSKIAFFDDRFQPNIRMNGNCAGGTGAFIEQMAVLLDEPIETFNGLAERSQVLHPIASRCGVFAKTDIQALLSNRVSREDIPTSSGARSTRRAASASRSTARSSVSRIRRC
jgi:activator of 2-hydroxyglutaryl-CoA dehydratase